MTRNPVMDWRTRPCELYRLYNADDELLYIGITFDWYTRRAGHQSDKYWWPEVVRNERTEYPSRIAAALAERDAIMAELPRYNVQHHPDGIATRGVHPRDQWEGGLSPLRLAALTAEIKRLGLTREEASVLVHNVMNSRPGMPRTATRQEVEDARAQQAKRLAREAR